MESSPSSQVQYTSFLKTVKADIDTKQLGSLTIELTPISLVTTRLANAADIGQIADKVVLMAYDFHYRDSFTTGPVAPVGGGGSVREFDVEISIQEALKVMPAEKIMLGIPFYGYEWETVSASAGAGVIPGSGKTASHQLVEELLATCTDCQFNRDPISLQPYLIQPASESGYFIQIFYEDQTSLQAKLELAKKYRLGGVAVWALGYEGESLLAPLKEYRDGYWLE